MEKGKVYLIGAGPGDPGLMTLKGRRILEKCDLVIYDRLISSEILSLANPDAEFIYVGKASGHHALPQEEINKLLVNKAGEGKIVARLKGGDPFLFGRGGEEALYLKEKGFKYEIIPGITSAVSVPAYAGIPVTHRDLTSSFAVITGHEKPGKHESSIRWREIAPGIGTLVFLMGVENLEYICTQLIANGREKNTPVALIRKGTLPDQEVLIGTLATIAQKAKAASFTPPAITIVGAVVNLHEQLKWLEDKPLWGKRIVVTRARPQASIFADKIRDMGGEVIELPVIGIKKEIDLQSLDKALDSLGNFKWIIFTSVNGVDIFFEELKLRGIDIRDLLGIKICAIGPATRARIEGKGLKVDLVPDDFRAEGILALLQKHLNPGDSVLLPRARGAREILPETLRKWGVKVNNVGLYHAVTAVGMSPLSIDRVIKGEFDYLTFTSSSTVTNFVKTIGAENIEGLNKKRIACIGPVTAKTAKEYGFKVGIIAPEYTLDGLLASIMTDMGKEG